LGLRVRSTRAWARQPAHLSSGRQRGVGGLLLVVVRGGRGLLHRDALDLLLRLLLLGWLLRLLLLLLLRLLLGL